MPRSIPCCLAVAAALCAQAAIAQTRSFQGQLDPDNPNAVALIEFETSANASLNIQTWSFGGGVNAAGAVIAAGGFDPYASLFAGWGATAFLRRTSSR